MKDTDYLKSQQQYIEAQRILIENLALNIENDNKMIYIHKKSLKNNEEAITHERNQLRKYLELYPDLKDTNTYLPI